MVSAELETIMHGVLVYEHISAALRGLILFCELYACGRSDRRYYVTMDDTCTARLCGTVSNPIIELGFLLYRHVLINRTGMELGSAATKAGSYGTHLVCSLACKFLKNHISYAPCICMHELNQIPCRDVGRLCGANTRRLPPPVHNSSTTRHASLYYCMYTLVVYAQN